MVLWVCVAICAAVIFVGWIFSLKYNFNKINEEMQGNGPSTTESAIGEMQEMFDGVDKIIKQGEATMNPDFSAQVEAVQPKDEAVESTQ